MQIRNVVFAAAAALAVFACEERKNNGGVSPSPVPNESLTGRPVTNTGGIVPSADALDPIARAVNRSAISRFGDEESLAPTPDRVVASVAALRDAPLGNIVGMTMARDLVTKVAKERGYVLVLTADPEHDGREIAGWIYDDAFMTPSESPRRPKAVLRAAAETQPACKKGESSLRTDHTLCAKTCRGDGDCLTGVCDGAGVATSADWRNPETRYCVTENTSTP